MGHTLPNNDLVDVSDFKSAVVFKEIATRFEHVCICLCFLNIPLFM